MLNAAPYAGGVLAKGSSDYHRYVYQEANDATLAPIRRIEAICTHHRVRRAARCILDAGCADCVDGLRRKQAGACNPNARMGELSDPRGVLGGTHGASVRQRRSGSDTSA